MTFEEIKAASRDAKLKRGDYHAALHAAVALLERQERRLRLAEPILSTIETMVSEAIHDAREN